MNTIFDQMLASYQVNSETDKRNAMYEIMQQITLSGLYRGGFFEKASFYGGTCLRIFHKLDRFSEDMDFSLLDPDSYFKLDQYFTAISEEFKLTGRDVEIYKKDKTKESNIESAFLKDNTHVYNVVFRTEKSVKIKIEVDTQPPLSFRTEQKLLLRPFSFMTRCFTLPDLFAGKMHALVFRTWKSRVKGRDWYDFEWYVRNEVPLNFTHLKARIIDFNGIEMNQEAFMQTLKDRLSTTDINLVKRDVEPFIKHPKVLDIWSNEYFLQLVDKIKFE